MVHVTSMRALRRDIARSELRLNILRICARGARTIHDLIHAPDYPGIRMSIFSLQSEINVSVELGECKARALLVRVGKVPDPIVPGGRTELLRTSLLAFLLSPELCRAEPAAYGRYLRAWFAAPAVREALGGDWEPALALFAAFPELAHRAFYLGDGDPERRRFGRYHIRDLPTAPRSPGIRGVLSALAHGPLDLPDPPPGRLDRLARGCGPLRIALGLRVRRRVRPGIGDIAVQPLAGPELLGMRLLPARPC
ncbi:MAG: hypothetical protein GXO72_01485 [Caldiserica bacterium]|nr:hypothetical protein [Caldisericota bacterium]